MDPFARLISRRTGVVTGVSPLRPPARSPEPLRMWMAQVSDTQMFSPWPGDPVASGCAWWSDEDARMAALGEAVERYCGALVPAGLAPATSTDLVAAGQRVLDLAEVALFSEDQYQTPGFPFVPFEPDLPLRWVTGRDLLIGQRCAVPIGLVYTTVHRGVRDPAYRDEPRTNPVPYAGLAAGVDREHAERNALLELIERDAMTRSWRSGEPWPEVAVPGALDTVCHTGDTSPRVRLFQVPATIGVPVLAALVDDPVTGFLALGSAARADPRSAAMKAIAEAFQLHLMLYELDDPDSALLCLARIEPSCPLVPWRPDRRYRDSYSRGAWRDVRDLACHLQLYLDPRMRTALREQLGGRPQIPLSDVPTSGLGSAAELAESIAATGVRPISVDVTTSDLRSVGWTAIRIVAPGLYPNTPAAFPPGRLPQPASGCPLPLPYA